MILGLFIIGAVIAVLALASRLHEARVQLDQMEREREREAYVHMFTLMVISVRLPSGQEGRPELWAGGSSRDGGRRAGRLTRSQRS
jgi:hypothetical protein